MYLVEKIRFEKCIEHSINLMNLAILSDSMDIALIAMNCMNNINYPNGAHPLNVAVKQNSVRFVKFLLSIEGIDVNSTNNNCDPPLCLAIKNNQTEIVNLLLSHNEIDVNASSRFGNPLTIAASNKDIILVNRLIACEKINVNEESNVGSLFYMACRQGDSCFYNQIKKIRNLSLSYEHSKHHFNPLFGACCSGNLEIVDNLITDICYSVNDSSCEGPPLLGAVIHNHLDVVRFLIEHGADYKYVTDDGLNLVMLANKYQFYDIFKFILSIYKIDENQELIRYSISLGYNEYCSLILDKLGYIGLSKYLLMAFSQNNIKLFDSLIHNIETNDEAQSIISEGIYSLMENINGKSDAKKFTFYFIERVLKIPNMKLNSVKLLISAVKTKNFDILHKLLEYNTINVNDVYNGMTALGFACVKGEYYFIQDIINVPGVDVNRGDKKPIELCKSSIEFMILFNHPDIDLLFDNFRIFETVAKLYCERNDIFYVVLRHSTFKNLSSDQFNQILTILLKSRKIKNYRNLCKLISDKCDLVLSKEVIKLLFSGIIVSDDFTLFKQILDEKSYALTQEVIDLNIFSSFLIDRKQYVFIILELCSDLDLKIKTTKENVGLLKYCMLNNEFRLFKALVNYKSIDVNYDSALFCLDHIHSKYNILLLNHNNIKLTSKQFMKLCAKEEYHIYVDRFLNDPGIDINQCSIFKSVIKSKNYELYKKIVNHPNLVFEDDVAGFACKYGSLAIILDILEYDNINADLNTLSAAIKYCSFDVMRKVVDHKNFYDEKEALIMALEENQNKLAKYLLDRPLADSYQMSKDQVVLQSALNHYDIELVEIISSKIKNNDMKS